MRFCRLSLRRDVEKDDKNASKQRQVVMLQAPFLSHDDDRHVVRRRRSSSLGAHTRDPSR